MKSFALVFAVLAPIALFAQSSPTDPFVGTWKLDVAKSTFDPGPPAKSETITIGADGRVTVEGVEPSGEPENWSYTYSQGVEAPITGVPDSSVIEKRSGNNVEHTWKFAGGKFRGKGVLSQGGQTLTYTLDGTDAQGRHEHNVMVYERSAEAPSQGENSSAAGVWKLIVAKSQFSPGPAPVSTTVTIGGDRKVSVEEVRGDNDKVSYSFTPQVGVAVPVTGMENTTILEKKIDAHTFDHVWNMGGLTLNGHLVISDDGKTMTYTLTGTTPDGHDIHNIEIYEKQ